MQSKHDHEELDEELEEPWWRGPLKYLLALFLILLLILWYIPDYAVKADPRPQAIPTINDLTEDIEYNNETTALKTQADFIQFVDPTDKTIRTTTTKLIAASGCPSNKICHAKAIYYFIRDNLNYVRDPVNFEYVEDPKEVLATEGADCESGTLLMATMLESIGIDTELVLIPRHAFLRIKMPEARNKYKVLGDDFVYLDWTCSNCEFGEIPRQSVTAHKNILEIH